MKCNTTQNYPVLSKASPGWKSLNGLNLVLCLTASEDILVSFHWFLNHCLSSAKLNIVSDSRQSVKSHQLSVGRKRFPFSLGVVRSSTDVLVCTEKRNNVSKVGGSVRRGNRGARNERKGETSVLRFDDSGGLPHCDEYLTGR